MIFNSKDRITITLEMHLMFETEDFRIHLF